MANHKSALKRNRQNHKRNERNKGYRTLVKTVSKKVRNEAEAGNKEQAQKELRSPRKSSPRLVVRAYSTPAPHPAKFPVSPVWSTAPLSRGGRLQGLIKPRRTIASHPLLPLRGMRYILPKHSCPGRVKANEEIPRVGGNETRAF